MEINTEVLPKERTVLHGPRAARVRSNVSKFYLIAGLLGLALVTGGNEAYAGRDEAHAELEQTRVALQAAARNIKNDKFKPSRRAFRQASEHFRQALFEVRDNPAIKAPANDCAKISLALVFGYKQLVDAQSMAPEERATTLDSLRRSVRGTIKKMVLCDRVIDR